MDPVSQLLADNKIPIGRWGKDLFQFLTDNFEWVFDLLADSMKAVLDAAIDALLFLPPLVL
jgi:glycine betaine/proline transport system permease protein